MSFKSTIKSWITKSFGAALAYAWDNRLDESDTDLAADNPTRPYSQVELVFACVNKLIDGIAGLFPVISDFDDKIIESGSAWNLLFDNPRLSWEQFVTSTIGHYALGRDVFWLFTEMDGRRPKEIMVVPGSQMHPVTSNGSDSGQLTGWEFRGQGGQRAVFDLDEVHQWKNFNPYSRFHGLGPLNAASLSINYGYAASMFNSAALQNGAEPGLILTMPGRPTPEEVNLVRSTIDSRHRGPRKTKRTVILTGGMDVKTMALKMVDMQVAEISRMTDLKLCSTFSVPPELVGLVTEAQYAHGPAQRDFIFNTIIPLSQLFAGNIASGILSRFYASDTPGVTPLSAKTYHGPASPAKKSCYRAARTKAIAGRQRVFLWFDTDQHPTVQESIREVAEKTLKFTQAGVPLNQLIEAHDLPYDVAKIPWGDEWWIPMGQVPASYITEAGPEGILSPSLPEGEVEDETGDGDQGKDYSQTARGLAGLLTEQKTEKADQQQRLRLWKNWVISWAGLEREYNSAIRLFFVHQQRLLTAKLKAALKNQKAISTKADPNEIIARVVFDLRVEDGKLRVINNTFYGRAAELGVRQGLAESAGLAGDAFDAAVEQVKRSSRIGYKRTVSNIRLAKVNQITRDRVAQQLTEGLDKGESLAQLTDRVAGTFDAFRDRALTIARTQTAGAINTGRHESFRHATVAGKSWITSGDDHVRDSHKAAGATYAKPIPLDQPFFVDGEALAYPGDPSGSAKNIANCRCLEIAAAIEDGKGLGLARYPAMTFYSYDLMRKNQPTKKDI